MKIIAEYIWLDGTKPVASIRGKTKIFDAKRKDATLQTLTVEDMPIWGFDGSSTNQAEGSSSDCVLKPVRIYPDPFRAQTMPNALSVIVLNEVFVAPGDKPHPSNTRAALRDMEDKHKSEKFWFGLEQEYTFMRPDGRPFGFPQDGEPAPQGPYYCGAGTDKIFGRPITDEHIKACIAAGILIAGINSEVMPGQWEYQIGNGTSDADPLHVADDLVVARYLMDRIGEKHGVVASLAPKPVDGDWNGAGAHTNFSTESMRKSDAAFGIILERLKAAHREHIDVYGHGIEKRLTGKHETCDHKTFRHGVSDRGASIRIPWQVAAEKRGYLEDRRPCANIDPYVVCAKIMETVAG